MMAYGSLSGEPPSISWPPFSWDLTTEKAHQQNSLAMIYIVLPWDSVWVFPSNGNFYVQALKIKPLASEGAAGERTPSEAHKSEHRQEEMTV